jgi:hypothetical protein
LLDLLARAGIEVKPYEKHPGELAYFCKGGEQLWVALPALSPESPNPLFLSPDSRGDALLCEVLRMLYASGARWLPCPSCELYVSPEKEVPSALLSSWLGEELAFGSFSNPGSASVRGPGGIMFHQGPAADPETGAARSYVAIEYPTICFRHRRRQRLLNDFRHAVKEFGFVQRGWSRRFGFYSSTNK